MSTRTRISLVIYGMVQAVLFFIGTIATLMLTDQSDQRAWGIVTTIALSILIGVPLTWWLAPRLRARYVRENVPPLREDDL
ncbi:MAG: hypothetical protein NVV74_24460 [Magnetospirillum sp.]|nr:hypothetical protein [Magnetospirillum sp.]